jgi:hypothetical protein
MSPDPHATTEELLATWHTASLAIDDTEPGTPEHAEALRIAYEAHQAYQARIDALKDNLRDG